MLAIDNIFLLKQYVFSTWRCLFFLYSFSLAKSICQFPPTWWSPHMMESRNINSHIYCGVLHRFMVLHAATMNLYQEMLRHTVQRLSAFFSISSTFVNGVFKETLNLTAFTNILRKFSFCFIYMLQWLYTVFWMTFLQTISFCTVSALMKRQGTFFAHLNVLGASRGNFSDT